MSLICRRFLSSLINGLIIFIILAAISIAIAYFLWFDASRSSLNMKWFYFAFAMTYSLLGSTGTGFLPKLGGRLSGIKLYEIKSNHRKIIKIVIRLALFYLVPLTLLFGYTFPFNVIASSDPKTMVLLIIPFLFCSLITLFIIPISIVIGKGHQGIHDAIAGLVICRLNREIGDLLSLKKLVVRSFIATTVISFFSLILIFKFMTVFEIQSIIFNVADRTPEQGIHIPIIQELDSLIPITPIQYRSYDFADDIRWWVDLTSDAREQIRVNKEIGLTHLNVVDLLGYGFSVKKLKEPVCLLHIDRVRTKIIPAGSEIISVFLFMDVGAFYYPEIKEKIHSYFATYVTPYASRHKFDAIRVKSLRITKVGFAELGFFDEFYLTDDDTMWRDEELAYFPVIFNIDSRLAANGMLITSTDLD